MVNKLVKHHHIYELKKNGKTVYVGKTINLEERMKTHTDSDKDFDSYNILCVCSNDVSDKIEDYFIMKLDPPYNQRVNFKGIYFKPKEWCKERCFDEELLRLYLSKRENAHVFNDNYTYGSLQSIIRLLKKEGKI